MPSLCAVPVRRGDRFGRVKGSDSLPRRNRSQFGRNRSRKLWRRSRRRGNRRRVRHRAAKRATTARPCVRAVRTGSRPSRFPAAPCAVPVRRGDGHADGATADGFAASRFHHAADGFGRATVATVPPPCRQRSRVRQQSRRRGDRRNRRRVRRPTVCRHRADGATVRRGNRGDGHADGAAGSDNLPPNAPQPPAVAFLCRRRVRARPDSPPRPVPFLCAVATVTGSP